MQFRRIFFPFLKNIFEKIFQFGFNIGRLYGVDIYFLICLRGRVNI